MWISNENRVSWILTISRILQFMGGLKHCWIHKNREWLKLEGTSNNNFVQSPAHAGPSRVSFQGICLEFPRRLLNLSGKPLRVPGHSHREKAFPDIQMELPVFGAFCLIEHRWKEPAPELFAPSIQISIHIDEILPELSFRMNSPSYFSPFSQQRGFSPLVTVCCTSLVYWAAQDWTQHSKWGHTNAEQRGRITSLNLLMQPRIPLAAFAARACCCLFGVHHVPLLPLFSAKLTVS